MSRDLRSLRFTAASLSLIGLAAGCVSVLGDFGTGGPSPGTDAGGDGATDASNGADGTSNDSATDAIGSDVDQGDAPIDAAGLFLNCDAFTQATPITVDDLSKSSSPNDTVRTFDDRPGMVSVSQNIVRIVERKPQSSNFTIYTIDRQNQGNPNASGRVDVSTNDNVQRVARLTGGTGILTQFYGNGTIATSELHLFVIPDSAGPTAPPPAPVILAKLSPQNTNNFGANFIELASGDYFYALTYQDPTTTKYLLQVGRSQNGNPSAPVTIATATQRFDNLSMLHFGSKIHLYSSSDPTQGSAQAYSMSDTADPTTVTGPRDLGTGGVPVLLFDAQKSPGVGFNLAFIEVAVNSTTALATFRVGTETGVQLDTFKAHDLPQGPIINDASQLPVDKGSQGWFGDDFVAIGKGSPATNPGLNFVWIDSQGHTRGMRVGKDAVLADRTAVKTGVAISSSQKVGLRYVTWNVAWSETHTDATGNYDILYLNELACH